MFKTLCRGVRNHTGLFFGLFNVIGAFVVVPMLRPLIESMSTTEELATVATVTLVLFIGMAFLCSFLSHCADAMDYIEQHPFASAKEAWDETKFDDISEF